MKITLIICLAAVLVVPSPTLLAARSPGSMVNVSYDKFEDLTQVSTNLSKVDNAIGRNQQKQDLRLQVLYVCTGDTRHCRPDKVEFKFVSYSAAEHVRSHQLILIAGGKRMRVEPRWAGVYEGTGRPAEHMTAAISLEEFLNVASAEKVEGKLGETTFMLGDDNFAAMRALAGEMGLPAGRQKS